MKILVTGANGFVGKHLVKRLKSTGYEVFTFDVAEGDLSLTGALDAFLEQGISHVFHLAGKTSVQESWTNPEEFYRINLNGTLTTLEFCRKSGAKMTHISSYLYGAPDYLPIDENHPLKAYNPYGHSKLIAENTCVFYRNNFDVQTCILRPFNIYGPGQPAHFLIQEVIEKVNKPLCETITVMDLSPRRDYIYIDDLIDAFLLSIDGKTGIYNLGSGESYSAAEIVDMIMTLSHISKAVVSSGTPRKNEILDLYADISKAARELGWTPKTSLEQGLKLSIQAYLKEKS